MQKLLAFFIFSIVVLLAVAVSADELTAGVRTGSKAPDFELQTYDGKTIKLSDFIGKTVVLEWVNPNCPFVKRHYKSGNMPKLQEEYLAKGVVWLGINSTAKGHGDYLTIERAEDFVTTYGVKSSELLHDSSGAVGKLYGAKTTPHLFIVDPQGVLRYQGAVDDDSGFFGNPLSARNYVREALNALLEAKAVATSDTKPYGCSVKYAAS